MWPSAGRRVGQKKAVVLLSGGLDSCVSATIARCEGYRVFALSFDYGQRHGRELQSAHDIARAVRVEEHRVLRVPLGELGGSALTDDAIEVPDAPGDDTIGDVIPPTYVPARNTIFLSFALAYAEVVGAQAIFIGANALDYSGYPDCRPEYLEAFQTMANLATKQGIEGQKIRIVAPLLEMTKKQIVQTGLDLKAPLHLSWSCYRGSEPACGTCESCVLRQRGFEAAGTTDPIAYLEA